MKEPRGKHCESAWRPNDDSGDLADPHSLTELRFWITNLDEMTGLMECD